MASTAQIVGLQPGSGTSHRFTQYLSWTLVARIAGAAKEILLAAVFGTLFLKDALVVAWTVPTLMASYCNETLPAVFTPLWVRPGEHQTEPARRKLWPLISAVLGLQTLAAALAWRWPGLLVHWIAPALSRPARGEAITLERILAANILLIGAQALLTSRLNARRQFSAAPAATTLAATVVLAGLALSRGRTLLTRMLWTASAITLGNAAAAGILLFITAVRGGRAGARSGAPSALGRWGGGVPGPAEPQSIDQPWRNLGLVLVAMLVLNLVPLAERMAASALRTGALAAYDYGERLVQLVFSLTVAPFTAVAFTRLSELAATAPETFAQTLEKLLRSLLVVATPIGIGLAVFADLLTRAVLGWGQFSGSSLALTAPVVAIKGAGLGLDAAFYFLLFALYARGRAGGKLPLALILAAVNIPLAFWWSARWGLAGLAAAHVAGTGAAVAGLGLWPMCGREHLMCPFRAGMGAAALALPIALAVRFALPVAVRTGSLRAANSGAWLLLAVAATAVLTLLTARALAPGIYRAALEAKLA